MHLVHDLGQVFGVHQRRVLDFEEVLTTMPVPVHENARVSIGLQSFGLGQELVEAATHHIEYGIGSEVF